MLWTGVTPNEIQNKRLLKRILERNINMIGIDTERLILRTFEEQDYDDLYELLSQRKTINMKLIQI